MKKFILGIATLGLMTFGLSSIALSQVQEPLVSYAEGESEEPIQETINNSWEYVLKILKTPLVIGGVSTSIGAIVLFALAKLFTSLNKRKIVALGNQVKDLSKKIADNASKQKLVELAQNIEELKEVVKVIADGTKNVNIREKANALLLEMKPLLEQVKEVIEKEEPVVEEKPINIGIQI